MSRAEAPLIDEMQRQTESLTPASQGFPPCWSFSTSQTSMNSRCGTQRRAGLAGDNPGKKEFEQRAKAAQQQLDREEHDSSRLFAIDAGPDKVALRSRYPDRGRYLILPGQVGLNLYDKEITGFLTQLNVNTINVPLADRAAIAGIPTPAPYTVRLAFGKRAEPWIMAVQAGEEGMLDDTDGATD